MRNIINVISGKGGTGKTLLTAVLAETLSTMGKRVLVIDMDIFVRGLTALLYFQKGEAIKIISNDEWSVSDFFKNSKQHNDKGNGYSDPSANIAICKYRSFDVVPSVASVDELLKYNLLPASFQEASTVLNAIIKKIPDEYEYIFLDSRAGYDSLIAATHRVSNISLCVEEDDNISMITSENLISQLKEDSGGSNVPSATILQIKNKARETQSGNSGMGVNFLGAIPFDADVMKSFGTPTFWRDIDNSLYKEALIKAWNALSKKMALHAEMPEAERVSPLGSKHIERRLSLLPTFRRVLLVYGVILLSLSIFLVTNKYFFSEIITDPSQLMGLIGVVLGMGLIVFAMLFEGKK